MWASIPSVKNKRPAFAGRRFSGNPAFTRALLLAVHGPDGRRREARPLSFANAIGLEATFDQLVAQKREYPATNENGPRVPIPIDARRDAAIIRRRRIVGL